MKPLTQVFSILLLAAAAAAAHAQLPLTPGE